MIFAVISIFLNITIQIITKEIILITFYEFSNNFISLGNSKLEYWFIFALGCGTLSGFIFKFVVDKFIVFGESLEANSIEKTSKQLSLYLGFAIMTTAIFWGFEFGFKIMFSGDWYLLGGIIGLAIGYSIKYLLDKKFVFKSS